MGTGELIREQRLLLPIQTNLFEEEQVDLAQDLMDQVEGLI
jgi:hypothetical protein